MTIAVMHATEVVSKRKPEKKSGLNEIYTSVKKV